MDIHEALEYARIYWTNPDDPISDRQVGMVLVRYIAELEAKLNTKTDDVTEQKAGE